MQFAALSLEDFATFLSARYSHEQKGTEALSAWHWAPGSRLPAWHCLRMPCAVGLSLGMLQTARRHLLLISLTVFRV